MKLASFLHILQTTSGPNGLLVPPPPPSPPSTLAVTALFSILVIELLSLIPNSEPLATVPWLLFFGDNCNMPLLELPLDAAAEVISCA